jgi:hypothetical protein
VPYWGTLTLDDYLGLIGEAFRTELEHRHMLPEGAPTVSAGGRGLAGFLVPKLVLSHADV